MGLNASSRRFTPSIYFALSKKSILTAQKFIAIIVRNLKFDAKVYFLLNRSRITREHHQWEQRSPNSNTKTVAFSALALAMPLVLTQKGKSFEAKKEN